MALLKRQSVVEVELKIFIAIFVIAVINGVILANLSDKAGLLTFTGLPLTYLVYASYIVLYTIGAIAKKKTFLRWVFSGLLLFMTLRIFTNLYQLITDKQISQDGSAILVDALLIWVSSLLVFSIWYWLIDRNGPVARDFAEEETRYDLLFPQYQGNIPGWTKWKPHFMDYVFFSFFTSTGFSPADTLPLTKRVKLLMMMEAMISLVIIGMVASRAISLIH